MDENAVIDSVCARLDGMGYQVMQRLTTTQRGVDIVALDQETGQQFFIEAKGNTSSRKGSKRFGQPYTQSQVFDRVAKGVFTCLRLRAEYPDRDDTHVVLAVPDGTRFRAYLTPVLQSLQEAGIEVWFEPVKGTGSSE